MDNWTTGEEAGFGGLLEDGAAGGESGAVGKEENCQRRYHRSFKTGLDSCQPASQVSQLCASSSRKERKLVPLAQTGLQADRVLP